VHNRTWHLKQVNCACIMNCGLPLEITSVLFPSFLLALASFEKTPQFTILSLSSFSSVSFHSHSLQNLVRPYRKLLRDSFIDAQFVPNMGKEKDHPQVKNSRLFLFTDCLLLARPIKKSFFAVSSDQKLKPIAVLDLRGAVLVEVAHPVNGATLFYFIFRFLHLAFGGYFTLQFWLSFP
jgi:hypothetical protein